MGKLSGRFPATARWAARLGQRMAVLARLLLFMAHRAAAALNHYRQEHFGRHVKTVCRHGTRGCNHVLNLALTVLLCLQGLLVWMILMGLEIPVPERAMNRLAQKVQTQGLRLAGGSVSFDLTGGIRIRDLVLENPDGQLLLKAAQIYVRVPVPSLLAGEIEPDILQIDEASLHLPPNLSPEGTERRLVEEASLCAWMDDGLLFVSHAQLVYDGRLPLHAWGIFPGELPEEQEEARMNKERLRRSY
jgi:hypothetical protein